MASRIPAGRLRSFFITGSGSRSCFIEPLDKAMWGAYGKNAKVISNGFALLILSGQHLPPDFDEMVEKLKEDNALGSGVEWRESIMNKVHLGKPLHEVRLFGRTINLQGDRTTNPNATVLLSEHRKQDPREWIGVNAGYYRFITSYWHARLGRPALKAKARLKQQSENKIKRVEHVLPVMARSMDGEIVLWGGVMPLLHMTMTEMELFDARSIQEVA